MGGGKWGGARFFSIASKSFIAHACLSLSLSSESTIRLHSGGVETLAIHNHCSNCFNILSFPYRI